MSQMSVATTVARRAPRGATRTSLHVVRSTDRAGSAWFPVLCVALLLAGLGAVLALNTWMAHDSFEVGRLEARSAELADTEAALTQQINAKSSPQNLAESAVDLGMVPSTSAAFIDVEESRILGVAKVAQKPDRINVDAAATATTKDSTSSSKWSGSKKSSDMRSDQDKKSDKKSGDKDAAAKKKSDKSPAGGSEKKSSGSTGTGD